MLKRPIKRGLFVPGPNLSMNQPEPFLLANHVYGPSSVSLESALSYWQLNPERVYETSSMTMNRSKKYNTPVGRFTYTHLPFPYYCFGQVSITLAENQVALIATPEKAICDKLIATSGLVFRVFSPLKKWLLEDIRIDQTDLRNLKTDVIRSWLPNLPKTKSFELLIKVWRPYNKDDSR